MGLSFSQETSSDQKTIHFSLLNSKDLLIIFTRNPELGKCKTRLAATVGDQIALDIYKFLLAHTVSVTKDLNVSKTVYYSEEIWENDIWDTTYYRKKLQYGNDLGDRMAHAFQEGFTAGYEKICIIGSDIFDIVKADLERAFAALGTEEYVIGPASDGGYYLLGMRKWNPALFRNKDWGKATVLADTLTDLKDKKKQLLEVRNDVDRYEDIKDVNAFKHFLKNI